MSDRQVRDETMTFVLAGHETTAVALTWTLYLLARHPHVEDALRAEFDRVLGGRVPEAGDLVRLDLAKRVVQETMRLYPPLWGFARQAVGPDVLGGFEIPAGTFISLIPYLTHRDPRLWPDPLRFDPDRFAPEAVRERPRFAYVPFSAGPRQCIGNEFALMEAQIVLAMMMQRFKVEAVDAHTIDAAASVTTRPSAPVLVRLRAL
jgi:cytochrome P450